MARNMNAQRILYVTMDPLEQNSSANIRNIGLIKGLVKIGYVVDTLSTKPDSSSIRYDADCQLDEIVSERIYFEVSKLYSKFRAKKNPQQDRNANSKKEDRIRFSLKALIKCMLMSFNPYDIQRVNIPNVKRNLCDLSKYDYIISSSDPKSAHLIVKRLFRFSDKKPKWIQFWGDPFFGDMGREDGKIAILRSFFAEKNLLSMANRVVYVSKLTLEAQKQRYKKHSEKMFCASQMAIPYQDWIDYCGGKITIGHFGFYSRKFRNIQPLVDVVSGTDMDLILCGDGDDIDNISANISVLGRCGYNEAAKMESAVNIIVCVCNKNGTQIPGKVFYAAGHDKPVIVVVDGENSKKLKEIFDEYNRFIVCDNTATDIKQAIEIAKTELVERKEIDGRHYPIPETLTEEYLAKAVLGKYNSNLR